MILPTKHLMWLWFWFLNGMALYMLKRAYYLVTGPNPVANTYTQFIQRCWMPLFIRGAIDSVIFWLCFNPDLLSKGLSFLGWSNTSWVVMMATQFAPVAFFFGHTIDSFSDIIVSKVPGLNNFLPQMPGPLMPSKAEAATPSGP